MRPYTDPAGELRKVIQEELGKALALPAGAVATPMSASYLAQLAARQANGQQYNAMPRQPAVSSFGPGVPLVPAQLDPSLDATGRPAPRLYEYEVSANLNINNRHVPFTVLRDLADRVSVIRQCIEIRKDAIVGLEWAFTIDSTRAASMAEKSGTTSHAVASDLRSKYGDLIDNLQRWWAYPDRLKGWSFSEWLGALLEDQLVLDAVSIYPHPQLNGDLHSLELVDGATIFPLRDYRGAVPQPPFPAYQQVMYGFPRAEFTSPSNKAEKEFVSALYGPAGQSITSDSLIYKIRTRRTHSPYGLSPTEQSIMDADLFLKRFGWLRAEYTDGVTPEMLMKLDGDYTPDQISAYETIFNADLAGRADLRHRAKFLAEGFDPLFPPGMDSKFSPDLDLHLIRLVCADFAVMPSSLGFVPTSGLGGSGHQEGEKDNELRRGTRPTAAWLTDLINEISRQWLGMPEEITFQFLGLGDDQDEETESIILDRDINGGVRTINEGRDAKNLPRFSFPLADQPFIMTGSGPQYLDPEVRAEQQERFAPPPPTIVQGNPDDGQDGKPPPFGKPKALPPGVAKDDPKGKDGKDQAAPPAKGKRPEQRAEAQKFLTFVGKRAKASGQWRDYRFEHHAPDIGAAANELGADGDLEAVKALFEMVE